MYSRNRRLYAINLADSRGDIIFLLENIEFYDEMNGICGQICRFKKMSTSALNLQSHKLVL